MESGIGIVVETDIPAISAANEKILFDTGYGTIAKGKTLVIDAPEVNFKFTKEGTYHLEFGEWGNSKYPTESRSFEILKNGTVIWSTNNWINSGSSSKSPYYCYDRSTNQLCYAVNLKVKTTDIFTLRFFGNGYDSISWSDNTVLINNTGGGSSYSYQYYVYVDVNQQMAKITDGILTVENVAIDIDSLISIV